MVEGCSRALLFQLRNAKFPRPQHLRSEILDTFEEPLASRFVRPPRLSGSTLCEDI
jgi:hypothetical protein